MNYRRLTVSLKTGIIKVVTWLGENFTTTAFKGIVRLSENDDFKAFENALQIGRLAGRSGVY